MAILARYEREIKLLREHRTRPGADLVTGNLDAREALLYCFRRMTSPWHQRNSLRNLRFIDLQ